MLVGMHERRPRGWVLALLRRLAIYGLLGALLCAVTGAALGASFGAGIDLHLNGVSFDGEAVRHWPDVAVEGVELGGVVGAVLGFVQGLALFVVGAWLASPHERGLADMGGMFWSLARHVPVGQMAGSLLLAGATLGWGLVALSGAYGLPWTASIDVTSLYLVMGAPMGLVLGGVAGGILGISRAKADRLLEERN